MTAPIWLECANTFRIQDRTFSNGHWGGERLYFQSRRLNFSDCVFDIGESALKECSDVSLERCRFAGKYPLWNTHGVSVSDCNFDAGSRAGIWYSRDVILQNCRLDAPKLLRECKRVVLDSCISGDSFETGWHCSGVELRRCELAGNYLFMHASDLLAEDCIISGNYALQYVKRATLRRCTIDSKDILWHAEDAVLEDCDVTTEYLAWHAREISFVRCRIRGPQPLCYADNIRVRRSSFEGADRSFEFSSIDAEIDGRLDSVLNPFSGRIEADKIGFVLQDDPRFEHSMITISARSADDAGAT